MRIVMFYHSLISDWNHGNAHFLRGIASELLARGHVLTLYEPGGAWSLQNLLKDRGVQAISAFHDAYPELTSTIYDANDFDLDRALHDAELVIVHEWNEPELVARIGAHRARYRRYRLLFHDTHHRAVSAPHELSRFDLRHYDGVLAFGELLRERYLANGWTEHAWTWHEAADTRKFYPLPAPEQRADLVWIGNWGDGSEARSCQTTCSLRSQNFAFEPTSTAFVTRSTYKSRSCRPARAIEGFSRTSMCRRCLQATS